MVAVDHRNQPLTAADVPPMRAGGLYQQQPSRIKSFFLQNHNTARKILIPLIYTFLGLFYFYNLIYRDVGSGVHVLQHNNINKNAYSSAPIWSSLESGSQIVARLEPRSLADVTIANAEVAWQKQVEHQKYLRRQEEKREEQRKKWKEERALRVAAEKGNGTAYRDMNATEQLILLKMISNSSMSSINSTKDAEEYIKKLTNLQVKRTPMLRRRHGKKGGDDLGFLPVLLLITTCTMFRLCTAVLIGHTANLDALDDSDGEDGDTADATRAAGRGGLTSFITTGLGGGRDAARLRRRARSVRANRQFQRFVDRLNAEREANGERPVSADTLRHLVNTRDFNGNDYDQLHSFIDENGPALGSFFSAIGATEVEINRCPSRSLEANDDLLRMRQISGGGEQHQTCSVCLEPYHVGETVRTIPCFHTFHKACIDPWLAQRAECPVCKHSAIG